MEIRRLRVGDDRSAFQSGDESLDRFFHQYAGQNQFRNYVGVTYVAEHEGRLLGFVTVAPRHLELEALPDKLRRNLPRYPVPVLGLARLAVDRSARSMGLGAQLLRCVLDLARNMAEELGCAGVVVDAKPGAVDFYGKYGFARFDQLEGSSEQCPRPTPMWLPIQAIIAAARPTH